MSKFTTVSREQFEEFLNKQGEFELINEPTSKEFIYDLSTEISTIKIRFYSSIDISNLSRSIGEDAIRCVLLDKISSKPIDKAKRTHRMENWRDRLTEKVSVLKEELKTLKKCPACGSVMVKRQGSMGEFYGCLNYPKCTSLIDSNGETKVGRKKETVIAETVRCPQCDAEMVKRSGRRGEFYGCTNFYKTGCRGTLQVGEVEIYAKNVEENEVEIEIDEKEQKSNQVEKVITDEVEIIPTCQYPHLRFKFKDFNPVQSVVFKYYDKDVNCVVAAATSAGKTTVAEMFMADSIAKGKKVIYLSPLKAVSQEKYDDWTNEAHDWSKLKVSIVTGDYQLTDKRVEELNHANVIIMTHEMLDSRTRRITVEKNSWLLDVGTVICDEAHLIAVKERGPRTESAIMRFTKQNPTCRVVLLSATMPNVNELARWLTSLNSKKTELINSNYRPCQLDVHYEAYDDRGTYAVIESNKIKKAIEITQQYKQDKFIIFTHTKQIGRNITKHLEDLGEKVEFHNAELDLKERVRVANEFKQKSLRVIVATSTLAWGINMPARRVIVTGVHRGIQTVEPLEIKQMVGRSGRVGLDVKGDAYVLLPQTRFVRTKAWCQDIPPITSTMNDQQILAFHIVSEISEGEIYDIETLMKWYNRSFAAFQNNFLDRIDAQDLLDKLVKIKILEKSGVNYTVTKLGRVAAYLYYSPYSISGWYFNFSRIIVDNRLDDYSISWALANIVDNSDGFASKDAQDIVRAFVNACVNRGYEISEQCAAVGIVYHACFSYSDEIQDYQKKQVKYDFERVCTALDMIDKMYSHWNMSAFWRSLNIRLQYEITAEQTELCTLKGIGGVRVRSLFDANIKTIADFKRRNQIARNALGDSIYFKVLEDNKEILGN